MLKFTYTNDYYPIKPRKNVLAAQLSCLSDQTIKSYYVVVFGVATSAGNNQIGQGTSYTSLRGFTGNPSESSPQTSGCDTSTICDFPSSGDSDSGSTTDNSN